MFTKAETLKFSKRTIKNFKHLSGFEILRLKDFLKLYENDMNYDFSMKVRNYNSPYEIFCLVDTREGIVSCLSKDRKRMYRKSGSRRRRKMQHQYYYSNVFNRIHGYVMLENVLKNIPDSKNIVSLSLICSSSYSNKKAIGSSLMNFTISICETKFTDIVLEVANEFAEGDDDENYEEKYETDYEEEYETDDEEYETDNTHDGTRTRNPQKRNHNYIILSTN